MAERIEQPDDGGSAPPVPSISPPMAPWQVFLLCLLSFCLYSSFWMYRAAADLEQLDTEKRIKVLWFLAPLLPITLLGAIPRLLERYDVVREKVRWTSVATPIAFLAFLSSLALGLGDQLELPVWVLVLAMFAYSLAFAFLQVGANDLKEAVPEEQLTRKPNRFSVWHWLLLVVGGLLWLLLALAETLLNAGVESLEPVEENSFQLISQHNVGLLFTEKGWERVAVGSFSDGTASSEFKGPRRDHWIVTFDHGPDLDFEVWLDARTGAVPNDALAALECRDWVRNDKETYDLIATVTCRGSVVGTPALQVHQLRSFDGGYWEAMGYLAAPEATFAAHEGDLSGIVKSLEMRSPE